MDSRRKKAFFEQWFADKLKSTQGANKLKTTRSSVSETKKETCVEWMSKEMAETRLEGRPDPNTGLAGENDLECKFWFDQGAETEFDRRQKGAENDRELGAAEKVEEAKAHFDSIIDGGAGGSGAAAPSTIEAKKEFGEFTKTVESFKADPKSTCRNVATVLTELKRISTQTRDNKYAATVRGGAKSLAPKAKRVFNILNDLHSEDCKVGAAILAMAQLLDPCFEKYNEISEWFSKPNGEKPAKELE
ncbi:unnamed protein product, partial [Prorocentrum cordatum]